MKPLELPGSYSHEDLVEFRKLGLTDAEPSDLDSAKALYLATKATGAEPFPIVQMMADAEIPWVAIRHVWPSIIEGIRRWDDLIALLMDMAEIDPFLASRGLAELPSSHRYLEGNLKLINLPWVTDFPSMIGARGDVILKGCKNLQAMPSEELYATGSIVLARLPLPSRFPVTTSALWNLDIHRCPMLASLGKDLSIGNSIRLNFCKHLSELPRGLRVCADLSISNCPSLLHFPKGVRVGGTLALSGGNQKMLEPVSQDRAWFKPCFSKSPRGKVKVFATALDLGQQ